MIKAVIFDCMGVLYDGTVNQELLAYIHDILKPTHKIGLLSNAGSNYLNELFSKEQQAMFDASALSYETFALKPAARAYEIIAERLDLELNECMFVDDQPRYCQAARDAGMQAITYIDFNSFKTELELVLGS